MYYRSPGRMFSREQQRPGTVGHPTGTADVGVHPDVLLPGPHAHAAQVAQLLTGQLLQRFRHVAVAHGHQPDRRVPGADPIAQVRRRAEHDRPAAAPVQVSTSPAVAQRVRGRLVLGRHRLQVGHHRHEHTATVPGPILPVLHRVHGAHRVHKPGQHPVRGRPTVVRGHQQVRSGRELRVNSPSWFRPRIHRPILRLTAVLKSDMGLVELE